MRGVSTVRRTAGPVAAFALLWVAALAVAACATFGGSDGVTPTASPSPTVAARCAPTLPNGEAPPGEGPSRRFHGNGKIWTEFWPRGVVVFAPGGPGEIRADGSLAMKFPFWRGPGATGDLVITGRSLDGAGEPLTGEVPDGYGVEGFQATVLVFPRPGCWEVTARVGQASLTFVTEVVRRQ